MRVVRIGVVEDDQADCQRIVNYLERYQREHEEHFIVSTFSDGAKILEHYTPAYDIVLLDIEMKPTNGMETARRIRECDDSVVIVFTTAAPQYAIGGYEVRALSYLLKPIPWFAFSQELKRSIAMVRRRTTKSIVVESGSRRIRLDLADIVYIESHRHAIVIHTFDGGIPIASTLKSLETQLLQHDFFRSNSCYLVNLQHVAAIEDQDCIMSDGTRLRISRPRKREFLTTLADYMGSDT
ncbi:MAG: LytTR family DNA-binding domain-containing protein [Bifidobacterium sp.]|jgi:DNA-binding LytR/AlgR family response regulator|nr:LytTR family DNA-binding domain-containing protein [Bifidobacterium sp.]MCI1864576.1 LytTR family DNA-binding domain-containing protein [Bifidobacterium sp.]